MNAGRYDTAIEHLRGACEVMSGLIDQHRSPRFDPVEPERYFDVLVCSIVGQQLSVRAADTIEARLRDLVGALNPRLSRRSATTSCVVLACPDPRLPTPADSLTRLPPVPSLRMISATQMKLRFTPPSPLSRESGRGPRRCS